MTIRVAGRRSAATMRRTRLCIRNRSTGIEAGVEEETESASEANSGNAPYVGSTNTGA